MSDLLLYSAYVPICGLAFYLAAVATLSVLRDQETPLKPCLIQLLMAWLVPIAGPLFVLHVMFELSPQLVPVRAVPRPFRQAVTGAPRRMPAGN